MIELTPDESRVLGVLIEKSFTTPDQYPLSLNAVVSGSNQKNNRDPVISMAEDQAFAALEGLREKGLVVRVDVPGNRVPKYKHSAGDVLHARAGELAILAELMLRGPQTLGELRGRASRMSPMDSLEAARELLRALMQRDEPLVKQLSAAPGSRADTYAQVLCPDPRAIESATAQHSNILKNVGMSPAEAATAPPAAAPLERAALAERVARLEQEMENLKSQIRNLSEALGQLVP